MQPNNSSHKPPVPMSLFKNDNDRPE